MQLDPYMTERNLTDGDLAKVLLCNRSTVRRYRRGHRIPKPHHMRTIYSWSGGLVDANAFYELPEISNPSDAGGK